MFLDTIDKLNLFDDEYILEFYPDGLYGLCDVYPEIFEYDPLDEQTELEKRLDRMEEMHRNGGEWNV